MAKGITRGLSTLFGEGYEEDEEAFVPDTVREGGPEELLLSSIYPNPAQPRKVFDENAMNDLANSIREHGVISPIVVNKNGAAQDWSAFPPSSRNSTSARYRRSPS